MKIAFIIDQVYLHGGIERVLSIKANYFSTIKNNAIYIITTEQKQNKACYPFNNNITFQDLKINYYRNKSYFHPVNLLKVPTHILKTKKALNKIKPDIVVVCSHSVDTYFIPFINKNIPKVKEFHFSKSIETHIRQNPTNAKKKYFLKFADFVETKYHALVVLNNDEAHYFKTNNVTIIPNPLTFYPTTVSNVLEPLVIAAGRISEVKRFDKLIDIWALVHQKNSNWKLHIYGTGDSKYIAALQNKINNKKLQDVVVLKGSTNNIQSKMLNSSLFVMTSDNECFPLVLLEAQACGLPIISFDCPHGPRNIIDQETGILIKPNDIEGFSNAILKMITNENYRYNLGLSARSNAKKYSLDTVMEQWLKLFDNLSLKNK